MINLSNITVRRGPQILLAQTSALMLARQKIGVVGPNGCGKTTLFSVLSGKLALDAGDLSMPGGLVVAYLQQHVDASDASAVEFVVEGDQELVEIEKALAHAEETEHYDEVAELHARLGHIDGYSARPRAAQILIGLGFAEHELVKPMRAFSGGWRMRLNLARTLMCRSDLLLLDEPTNHLDLETVVWLEQWLMSYRGTLLVISHDREFLDNIADHILYFEDQKLHYYTGNYTSFEKQYAMQRMLQQKQFEKQQHNIAHLNKFIDRFRAKATKAKQAQSRIKALEKMQLIAEVKTKTEFDFEFKLAPTAASPLLTMRDVSLGYSPEQAVLSNINWRISPGERIGLLGMNGAGKSTFIKAVAGELIPQHGECVQGRGLKIGYFAQHQLEQLDLDKSPLQQLQTIAPDVREQTLRNFLGGFAFAGEMAMSPCRHFSGGEKARLVLALIVWQAPNLLLLDEPTNHLDMDMRDALTFALQGYVGAMVIIAHDRLLLQSVCDEFYWIANQHVQAFKGDLADYLVQTVSKPVSANALIKKAENDNLTRENHKKWLAESERLERYIAEATLNLQEVDEALMLPSLYELDQKNELIKLQKKREQLTQQMAEWEQAWLLLQQKLEN